MADCGIPRRRIFVDVSLLLLLLAAAFAMHRRVVKAPPKPDDELYYPSTSAKVRRSIILVALGLLSWGVLGLVLGLARSCADDAEWLVALCLSLAGGCLFVGTWLGVNEALVATGFNLLTLLACLRCSCCSRVTKRVLLLPPLLLLVVLNVASWLEKRHLGDCNASELLPPPIFFAGAAFVFLAMLLATLLVLSLSSFKHRSVSTRVDKVLVVLGLAVFALTSIGWAVAGWASLPRHQDKIHLPTTKNESCWGDRDVLQAAQWSIVELLMVGCLLLVTTFCCRLENFFLAPNAPEVDAASLSPRLSNIRNPAERGATQVPKPRTPQNEALV